MILNKLLSGIITESIYGDDTIVIENIAVDSRKVTPGSLFVAVPGPCVDGHDFIPAAIEAGAVAIVCERMPETRPTAVTWICVPDAALALGVLASEWYGNPSSRLTLVGVTGTNGKTTIATLLYETAMLSGRKAGLISTVENRVADKIYPSHNTTPSPLETNALLSEMVNAGCTFAAMEVSSHGQVQKRTAGLRFAGGIFTNITRDHLDYHKTFAAYIAAKKSFFDNLPSTAWALTNADDPHGSVMLQNTRARRADYSLRTGATFRTKVLESRMDGTLIEIDGRQIQTRFAGLFNAYNLTAVYGACVLMGMDTEKAAVTLSALRPVCGRFEATVSDDGVIAVVDYAHTPDALENVLETIRASKGAQGRIITVFGAGGNRDKGKRPQMGAVAARLSDRVIITSDNPRDEDPYDIADDVKAGIPVDSDTQTDIIAERAAAIHVAITEATPGDVVLVAGKGHEDYQVFENGRTVHFDDHEQVRNAFAQRLETN